MTENRQPIKIKGKRDGERLPSRILEEEIQKAVKAGHRQLTIQAFGQHGIGGRLWKTNGEPVTITVEGQAGQRMGSMGYPGTFIDVLGPASDDVGWAQCRRNHHRPWSCVKWHGQRHGPG